MVWRDLGGEEDPVADPADGLPDDFLGAVGLRRVDQGSAQFDAAAKRFAAAALVPGTQTDLGQLGARAPQRLKVHREDAKGWLRKVFDFSCVFTVDRG
jgi:hypothetical protein